MSGKVTAAFRGGERVTGMLLAMIRHGNGHYYATYKYTYEVGGGGMRASSTTRNFSAKDAVSVLYDPQGPAAELLRLSPGRPQASRGSLKLWGRD